MNTKVSSTLLILCMLATGYTHGQDWPGQRDSIYSNVLKEQRRIQVILPKEYSSNTENKFEVLYVLDGEWYMEQIPFIYRFAASSGYAPPNIFVLIPNTYEGKTNLRDRDFSPTSINNAPGLGGADNFHAFLKDELIPFVENKYRTNGKRSLVGSSFSGLFSVYAFVKDPKLFNSFVASDPNLNWDNNYVTKMAAEKLPGYTDVSSTLFIAGLTSSYAGMGIAAMDSALKSKAPTSLRWKFIPYEDETHYSVQHKAFYDGFRFSHFGYDTREAQYHPMKGILEAGKPLKLLLMNESPGLRFTTDGSEPTSSSPLFKRDQVILTGPGLLKIKSFPNRTEYVRAYESNFVAGAPLSPGKKSKSLKAGLSYSVYEGGWNTFPSINKLKPLHSGKIADGFDINSLKVQENAAYLVEGTVEIPEDGYYIFAAMAGGSKAIIGDHLLFDENNTQGRMQSYVIPLKKGPYPIRIELFKPKDTGEIHFIIARTTASNDRWWETQIFRL